MRNLSLGLIFAGMVLSFGAFAKPTVCTITINSDAEAKTFRKNLPPSQWDFRELLPHAIKAYDEYDSEDGIPDWLESSCEKGLQCDILVISGHFGGRFFGKSNYELTTEQLERAACKPGCAGILRRPKEVFLFGCNTLATKSPPGRTQEQYAQILIHDGQSPADAEQSAAFLYSPWGDQTLERMRSIFSESAKIYGFSNVGPLGNVAAPKLAKYFSRAPRPYIQYINNLSKSSPPNRAFLSAFSDTPVTETSGSGSSGSSAICYLENPEVSDGQKARFIEASLTSQNPEKYAPAIANWLDHMKQKDWSDHVWRIWDRLAWNTVARDKMFKLTSSLNGLPTLQIQIWRFAKNLHWLNSDEFKELQRQMILQFFSDLKINDSERDTVCSITTANEKVIIDYQRLGFPALDFNASIALACLGNADHNIVSVLESMLTAKNDERRGMAITGLQFTVTRGGFQGLNTDLLRSAAKTESDPEQLNILNQLINKISGRGGAHSG